MSHATCLRPAQRRKSLNLACLALGAAALAILPGRVALAVVTATGSVSPIPPSGGGNMSGPLVVGDSGVGTLTNQATTAAPAQTPLNVNGNIVVGDDDRTVGTVSLSGSGFNLTSTADLLLGNNGSGTIAMSNFAKLVISDDMFLGVVDDSSGRLFVSDLGTIAEAADDITVGQAGTALVQVTNGGRLFAESSVIGANATADGTVTVSGNDSLWEQTGSMTIGDSGRGYVQAVSQARFDTGNVIVGGAASGVGSMNVSGAGSYWEATGLLTIGSNGQGQLNITEGGRVHNTGAARIANLGGSEGRVVVSGMNSTWTAGTDLIVGGSGFGSLRVFTGGQVISNTSIIGDNISARGESLVDGVGSLWDISGTLMISDAGEAVLGISNGGRVATTGNVTIGALGQLSLAAGRLEVSGAAASVVNQGVIRGSGQVAATVTNSESGLIRAAQNDVLTLSKSLTNAGTVSVEEGELDARDATNNGDIAVRDGLVRFRGTGLINSGGSQLAIVGGHVDVFGIVDNQDNAQIVIGGNATAVFHDAVSGNGDIHVMQGANALFLEDLDFMPSSSLSVQLGAMSFEETHVEVSGEATLAGMLKVSLANGFSPQAGQSFEILQAAEGLTGTFNAAALPSLAAGLNWDVDYTSDALLLSVVPGLTADFNLDGAVNNLDLAIWKAGFGAPNATTAQGDADADGDVDGADFLAWQRQYGATSAASAGASAMAAVPEPAFSPVFALGLALAAARRRRPRGR